MISHYLRGTWRAIRRNPMYSFISIGCLAIGIAVSLTILVYVLHEHSYDRWQTNARRIYQVTVAVKWNGASFNMDRTSFATGELVRAGDPRVEGYLRLCPVWEPMNIRDPATPDQSYVEKGNFAYADSNFFSFFSFRLKRGDPARVLSGPSRLVLSEQAAKKYFGSADPVGRTLHVGSDHFQITGVYADPPSNTDLKYDFIASASSLANGNGQDRKVETGIFKTWLLLKPGARPEAVEHTLARLSTIQGQPEADKNVFTLLPLANAHLDSHFSDGTSGRYLHIFPLVAGLILLLALVNYMSLSTARAAARAKEVGVRKVLGAGRDRIAGQFYLESAVFALLSFATGMLLFLLGRSYFLNLLHLSIDTAFLLSPQVLACFAGLLVVVILLAGSYPSLVLSAFRPVAVLYGRFSRQRGGERVRKGFIVFQFAISMSLVLCSWIIGKELYFIRHTDTGMDRENVLMVPFRQMDHYAAFKQDITALPGVGKVGMSIYPLYGGVNGWAIVPPGGSRAVALSELSVDESYIPMLGLRWAEKPGDVAILVHGGHILLNQSAVAKLGLQGDPVGQRVMMGNDEMMVSGVLRDFVYGPMRDAVKPLIVTVNADSSDVWRNPMGGCLLAKIGAHTNIPTLIDAVRKVYRQYDPQGAFEYSFADDAFDRQYKAEDRLAGLMGVFTFVTILIACLGLFALATFSAQQRVREIGIRKILGASMTSIGMLLSRDFLRPVLLAIVIACPLSWWAMHQWLEDFAYRTTLSWWVFAGSGLGLLLVALVTVLLRSLRAGRANPVDNLRSD